MWSGLYVQVRVLAVIKLESQANPLRRSSARALAERSVEMAKIIIGGQPKDVPPERGGRKAHQLDVKAQI